jgi:hypothetical protein
MPSTVAPNKRFSLPIAKNIEFPTNTEKYPLNRPKYAV